MAANDPITIIHQGMFAGTLNASKIPVINAEPSVIDWFYFHQDIFE